MKKIILLGLATISVTSMAFTQGGKTPAKPAPKPVTPVLKNANDSASYAIGVFVTNFYRQQGITSINTAMVSKAIADIQGNKPRALSDDQCNGAIMNYISGVQKKKAQPKIDEGEKFLATNKQKAGVVTTASGLQYEIITAGTGPVPQRTDTVSVNYSGKFIDGAEFDASARSGGPVTFGVTQVIRGWTEALTMMPVGSKWKVYVPYQLGYGPNDYMSIPGGSLLIFEMELNGTCRY
jgi:FKBP-type peptidyl-prolyl cis-trans isomerase